MNAKQLIVNIVSKEYERALEQYRKASADCAAALAASDTWDSFNGSDGIGGISQNPYKNQIHFAKEKREQTRANTEQLKKAYDLAVDTFLKGE